MHCGWNASLHHLGDQARAATSVVLVAALALSVLALAGMAGLGIWPLWPTGAQAGWVLLAGASEAVYFFYLGQVLSRLPLGLGYALMRGLSMVLVTAFSVALLGESLTSIKLVGMGAVALGLVMRAQVGGDAAHRVDAGGLALGVACAWGICGYHLAYGRALSAGMAPLPLFAASLALAVPAQLFGTGLAQARRQMAVLRQHGPRLLGTAALCVGAFWLFLACLGGLEAGSAICLRNSSLVFAQLLAWRLGEPVSGWAAASVAVIALGCCLLVYAP